MKKILLTILTIIWSQFLFSATSFTKPAKVLDEIYLTFPNSNIKLTITQLLELKLSDYKKNTGKKLSIREILTLKIAQLKIRKKLRKDGTIDLNSFQKEKNENQKFHLGGFLLGLIVPVGFIITLFFKDKNKKRRTFSALLGMLTVLAIGATVLVFSLVTKGL
jgi:hypothetical protein